MTLPNKQGILDNLINHLPVEYSDAEMVKKVFQPVVSKLLPVYLYLATQSSQDNQELTSYLNNLIGYGWERYINQSFIISCNDFFDEYSRLFNISLHDVDNDDHQDSRSNRLRLLLHARSNIPFTRENVERELQSISSGFEIREYPNSLTIQVIVTTENEHDKRILINRLGRLKHLHLDGEIIETSLTIDDGLTIDDDEEIDPGTVSESF